ncbi:DUF2147 domain-containing protein [Roseivirga sp. E12]|uniref:DUF2147 domain-containing protein n=1 Tax=Roseivirga sp. E12 TaxID=2819237 RepID=UPI001ABCA090|nr:DUF2147 domain-containing protein [Roseivirga sp. E12]MBO3697757.1 DUF2147 domain-containing protein [Roseivirga sp. E12]
MKFHLLIFLFSTLASPNFSRNNGDEVLGIWQTDDGKAKIEIYKESDKYFGKIVWLKEPKNEKGEIKRDKENPDETLRSRTIMGINLVKDFTFDGDDRWEGGKIYDPENGKTYSCDMKIRKGKLQVRGYIGLTMLGRTVVWTRSQL